MLIEVPSELTSTVTHWGWVVWLSTSAHGQAMTDPEYNSRVRKEVMVTPIIPWEIQVVDKLEDISPIVLVIN